MIRAEYSRTDSAHELRVFGHAEFDSGGRDIVCAGVSAVTWALLGYLDSLGMDFEVDSGDVYVCAERRAETDIAFDITLIGLAQIEARYPKNVSVCEM